MKHSSDFHTPKPLLYKNENTLSLFSIDTVKERNKVFSLFPPQTLYMKILKILHAIVNTIHGNFEPPVITRISVARNHRDTRYIRIEYEYVVSLSGLSALDPAASICVSQHERRRRALMNALTHTHTQQSFCSKETSLGQSQHLDLRCQRMPWTSA
jgi:hypothetical protein